MPTTYIQGEAWTQPLYLSKAEAPLVIGPSAQTASLVSSIEVLLKVDGKTQAQYRYPALAAEPEFGPIELDDTETNLLRIAISREQSRFFTPGYLYAAVLVRFIDAAFPAGRAVEVVLPLGYLLSGQTVEL